MIYTLRDLIPHSNVGTQLSTGQWVRAMHEPFCGGLFDRLRDAAAIVRGEAFAVRWPSGGDFEAACEFAEGSRASRD
jgi:hypothetical protein